MGRKTATSLLFYFDCRCKYDGLTAVLAFNCMRRNLLHSLRSLNMAATNVGSDTAAEALMQKQRKDVKIDTSSSPYLADEDQMIRHASDYRPHSLWSRSLYLSSVLEFILIALYLLFFLMPWRSGHHHQFMSLGGVYCERASNRETFTNEMSMTLSHILSTGERRTKK